MDSGDSVQGLLRERELDHRDRSVSVSCWCLVRTTVTALVTVTQPSLNKLVIMAGQIVQGLLDDLPDHIFTGDQAIIIITKSSSVNAYWTCCRLSSIGSQ